VNPDESPASAGLMGESLLAVIGLDDFLAREHRRVLVGDHAAAARLPEAIGKQLRAFVEGEAPSREDSKPAPRVDFMKVIDQLATPIEPADIEALIGAHRNPEDALELFVPLTRAVAFLNGAAPRRVKPALTGPEVLRPSDQEVSKFERVFAVVHDPTLILRRLRAGPLLADEVAAVQAVYPALYGEMAMRAQTAIADAMTARASFRMPRERERALRTLLPDLGPQSPGLVRDMQQSFADSAKAQQQAPPPRRKRADLAGASFQTTGQRAESGGK
jgi:hypothetical protein